MRRYIRTTLRETNYGKWKCELYFKGAIRIDYRSKQFDSKKSAIIHARQIAAVLNMDVRIVNYFPDYYWKG